jgi:hypothetical protein
VVLVGPIPHVLPRPSKPFYSALLPTTSFYSLPLRSTFTHILSRFQNMSRGNLHSLKKSCGISLWKSFDDGPASNYSSYNLRLYSIASRCYGSDSQFSLLLLRRAPRFSLLRPMGLSFESELPPFASGRYAIPFRQPSCYSSVVLADLMSKEL